VEAEYGYGFKIITTESTEIAEIHLFGSFGDPWGGIYMRNINMGEIRTL
jgi:hypothetical protein